MEQGKESKQKWIRSKNFDICFCVLFGYYEQNFTSGGETGH